MHREIEIKIGNIGAAARITNNGAIVAAEMTHNNLPK
jgi:hypothetical protein